MSLFDRFNLGTGFKKYFQIEAAASDAVRDAVYRVRHEVYCEELKFESERPDRREIDTYDAHSLHCLLTSSNPPHASVGCIRLVLPAPDALDAPLPFEATCAHTIDRRIIDPAKLDRRRIAEVSRLAVRSAYRRRKGEQHVAVAIQDEDYAATARQPRFPYIPVGLYLGVVALAARNDIDTLFVLTEPRLASHFSKLGVEIKQIGGPVEHRGTRVPSMMDVQSIIKGLRFMVKPIWRVIQEQIEASAPPR
ncbi:PEP-CTERM/exosortase system-associated acyltransferase [Denitromonas iodatirespirans]|uniref:PEP-CTERM/exosortase system-associated acyltransferase n=1 Tax=Denitromonas iodatirespirans TaxID=2795389 RepID=A0A944DBF3_DENI1|nr:PEP-CTERM/exosortase system-associated acyltransferase [Denitromonas iodatirespirans]MBT0963215.1 PEP-CTERM/exosortase system-associated acyltransferase [Denitromonas iodatirespirans]